MPATPDQTDGSTVWDEWESFRRLGHMMNHWDRPGWTEHTRSYHFFVTFEDAAELHALARRCQAELADMPNLDLVPPELLHLTLERAGFQGEIGEDDARRVSSGLLTHSATKGPFEVRVGPLTGSAGAIRFSVTPKENLVKLRDAVVASREAVAGKREWEPGDRPVFVPHVSIAYSNSSVDISRILPRVEAARAIGGVTLQITHLKLVELWREEHRYVWRELSSVVL